MDNCELWEKYISLKNAGTPSVDLRNKLIESYYFLVKNIAKKMNKKNQQVSVDEFTSMGFDGLLDAIEKYDPCKFKNKFETYASHRIRGAMLDEVRKSDWIPRLVRSNNSWIEKQRSFFESDTGRKLTNEELWGMIPDKEKEKKNITSVSDFNLFSTATTSSLNSDYENKESEYSVIDNIYDKKASEPGEKILRDEFFQKLMGKGFNPIERKIVWLYYFQEMSMGDISELVELSESRISQMHLEIKEKIKKKINKNPKYFSNILEIVSKFKETVAS